MSDESEAQVRGIEDEAMSLPTIPIDIPMPKVQPPVGAARIRLALALLAEVEGHARDMSDVCIVLLREAREKAEKEGA